MRRRKQTVAEEALPRLEEPLTFMDKLDIFAYSLFGGLSLRVARSFEFDKYLARAGIDVSPTLYSARVLLFTLISAYAAYMVIASTILFTESIVVKILVLILASMIPVVTFAAFMIYPSLKASSRSKDIEHELPFLAAYVSTMIRGGLSIGEALERLSRIRDLPGASTEAKRILRGIKVFGKDPISALEDSVKEHPNKYYRDFILGYTSTVRRGGDVIHYLYSKTEGLFEAHAATIRRIADRVALAAEVYVILVVMVGLGFYIFFAVSTMMPGQAGSPYSSVVSLILFAYLLMPLLSLLTLLIVDATMPKMVIPISEPNTTFILSIPLGVGVGLAILYFTGGWSFLQSGAITRYTVVSTIFAISIGLIALSTPPALHYSLLAKGSRGFEDDVASFLRDLVEVRKTGISPERCIMYTSRRSYGRFTPLLRDMAKLLSWGIPVRRAIERMIARSRNWFVRVLLTFLAEAIDVGGGSVEILEALARFAFSLAEYEKELRARIKPYVMMPYFGALMTVVSTILIVYFTNQTMAILPTKPPITLEESVFYFATSMVINAWLIGLVAGKISSQQTMAGLTHSTILVFAVFATLAIMNVMLFQF
ncbi:MAG: type II secretion system F family protein [Candidatus Bathyarchaeota archaeon]|nr:type II secretion system F family protein [Candidatus Bathyarchaeota archaeon]